MIYSDPFFLFTYYLLDQINAYISGNRLKEFMGSPEIENYTEKSLDDDKVIEYKDCAFEWVKDEREILTDLNFCVKNGELISIIGDVGAGKSTLLQTVFEEASKIKGTVSVKGSIAYCSQIPWIINSSVKNNILFGSSYNKEKYEKILKICELENDMKELKNGDLTGIFLNKLEIGENGINISGGQKARISLARACYMDRDIYLLDSPLSAVDAHVSKKIFKNCIRDYLKDKTVLLVTHSLQYLKYSDKILLLNDGKIDFFDNYENFEKDENTKNIMKIMGAFSSTPVPEKNIEIIKIEKTVDDDKENVSKLIKDEEKAIGTLNWRVYLFYFQGFGFYFLICFFGSLLAKIFGILTTVWLMLWSSDTFKFELHIYLIIYVLLGFSNIFIELTQKISFILGGLRSAMKMHNNMLKSILFSPISFFDSTPRIFLLISKFSWENFK
jgi:ATP-binding cassette, subfamily C (CFTR/MRP), member 1